MCACNCLDGISDGRIQDINKDKFYCISDELVGKSDLEKTYICTECYLSYIVLSSVRTESDQKAIQVVNLTTKIGVLKNSRSSKFYISFF